MIFQHFYVVVMSICCKLNRNFNLRLPGSNHFIETPYAREDDGFVPRKQYHTQMTNIHQKPRKGVAKPTSRGSHFTSTNRFPLIDTHNIYPEVQLGGTSLTLGFFLYFMVLLKIFQCSYESFKCVIPCMTYKDIGYFVTMYGSQSR